MEEWLSKQLQEFAAAETLEAGDIPARRILAKLAAAEALAEVLETGEAIHYLDLFTQYAFDHQEISIDEYGQRMKVVWDIRAALRQYREAGR